MSTGIKLPAGTEGSATSFQTGEVWARVTGKAVYGSDLILPDMLYEIILHSPHPHAGIARIDLAAASKLPGVRALLTGAELPKWPYGIVIDDELPLTADLVRYIGDKVAAVALVTLGAKAELLDIAGNSRVVSVENLYADYNCSALEGCSEILVKFIINSCVSGEGSSFKRFAAR